MPRNDTIKVLIVDDAARVRKAIGWILESKEGYEVVGHASEGGECLKKFIQLKPDLILLDINMPGMEGIETLKKLRLQSQVPVVIVSALPVNDDAMRDFLLEVGANACLPKVFGDDAIGVSAFESDLLKTIDEVMENHPVTNSK